MVTASPGISATTSRPKNGTLVASSPASSRGSGFAWRDSATYTRPVTALACSAAGNVTTNDGDLPASVSGTGAAASASTASSGRPRNVERTLRPTRVPRVIPASDAVTVEERLRERTHEPRKRPFDDAVDARVLFGEVRDELRAVQIVAQIGREREEQRDVEHEPQSQRG